MRLGECLTAVKSLRSLIIDDHLEYVVCSIPGIEMIESRVESSFCSKTRMLKTGLGQSVIQFKKLKLDDVADFCIELIWTVR